MRWVWIFAGLGDVADPKARRLCIYVAVFQAGAEFLQAVVGGRRDIPILV